jgi:hypothetical protein
MDGRCLHFLLLLLHYLQKNCIFLALICPGEMTAQKADRISAFFINYNDSRIGPFVFISFYCLTTMPAAKMKMSFLIIPTSL